MSLEDLFVVLVDILETKGERMNKASRDGGGITRLLNLQILALPFVFPLF